MNDVELLRLWCRLTNIQTELINLEVPPELEHDICSAVGTVSDALGRYHFDWLAETSVWVDSE